MRKEIFRMDRAEAEVLLAEAEVIHLSSITEDGLPLLRTLNAVKVRGALAFHGAPAGEKLAILGREAVASAERIIATIPSYFFDPERACPATTLYRSVQVHGRVEEVICAEEKAEVLEALMRKYQPEGGYTPIEAEHPLYRKAIEGLLVFRIPLERVDGKAKLAQNRSSEDRLRLMENLWARGLPGDPEAIEQIRKANPGTPLPSFLKGPEGTTLSVAQGLEETARVSEMLAGAYWNDGFTPSQIARAHLSSPAWVGARDPSGKLIATARALSDVAKRAWIYDVMVAPDFRGRKVGEAVMRLLLGHPALRNVGRIYLRTRDAAGFYERLGFGERASVEEIFRRFPSTEMALIRGG